MINRKLGLLASGLTLTIMLATWWLGVAALPRQAPAHTVLNLLGIPGLTVFLAILLAAIPSLEPRRANILRSGRAYMAIWISLLVALLTLHLLVVFGISTGSMSAQGAALRSVPVLLGLVYLVIGNYMGKIRSNFRFGVRNPWTLSSELSWNRTHRLGGRLLMVLGLAIAASALLSPIWQQTIVIGGTVAVGAVLGIYSQRVWHRDPDRQTIGQSSEPR